MLYLILIVLMLTSIPVVFAAADGSDGSLDRSDPGEAEPTRQVVYKNVNGKDLVLHIFEPPDWQAADKRPALVFFHGGGWRAGEPKQFFWQCAYLARRGMWTASAQYRLKPEGVKVADCIADAQDAVRYIRAHAGELGVDPARIAAGGGSAGGHLAAACAILHGEGEVSAKPNLLVLFNPALFHKLAEGTLAIAHFTKETPPCIQFYGSKDPMVEYGKACHARAREAGFSFEVHWAEDVGHGFFNKPPWRESTLCQADLFLAQHGYLNGKPELNVPDGARLKTEE